MIKKQFHQLWLGDKKMPKQWMDTWKKKHPNWEYKVWREKDIDELGLQNRDVYDRYEKIKEYAGMSDVARVEILWKYGGVYLDADCSCRNKLDNAPFMKSDFFCVRESERNLANGIMGSIPGHPLLEIYMLKLGQLIDLKPAWQKSGPLLLTKCVELYGSQRINILPTYTFLPETHDNKKIKARGKVYADHYWGSTISSNYNYDE